MFSLLVSVVFYRCIEKRHSKSFFATFLVEQLLLPSICKLSCINVLIRFKIWGFSGIFPAYDYYILLPFLFIIGQRTIQKLHLKCHLKPEHIHLVKDKCFPHLSILISLPHIIYFIHL